MVTPVPVARSARSRRRVSSSAAEIQLPHAADWRTTDQDEINRRVLRAREEQPAIRNLDPRQPIFSNFEVKSRSGVTYEVGVRDLEKRQFGSEGHGDLWLSARRTRIVHHSIFANC